ncbi:MAG: hypothetical protein RMH84_07095, partial [Sulfolobales archaeon]|nr:hypothetical protein [Sulfolobales archaeon]
MRRTAYSIYSRYPILMSLEELTRMLLGEALDVKNFIEYAKTFVDRAVARIKHAVDGSHYEPVEDPLVELPSFYLAIALAQHTHSWLLKRLADREGKRASSEIMKERDVDAVNILRSLGIEVEYVGELDGCGHRVVLGRSGSRETIACFPYRTTVPRYLRYSEKLLTEPSWKLVNRIVLKGYVYLSRKDLARLAEESVKWRVLEYGRIFSERSIGELLGDYLDVVRQLVPKKVLEREVREVPKKVEKAFPPCMSRLKDALSRGEHLSHHQRFSLATFMLLVGYSVDEVVNAFRTSPDF